MDCLFSGSREGCFVPKVNAALKTFVFRHFPQYEADPFFNIYLDYAIGGGFYAMRDCKQYDQEIIAKAIARITEGNYNAFFKGDPGQRG